MQDTTAGTDTESCQLRRTVSGPIPSLVSNELNINDTHNPSLSNLTNTASLKGEVLCRVCLYDDGREMCIPCLCKGSARYIHRDCLEKWREVSLNPLSKIQCDVCKSFYRFNSGNFLTGGMSLNSAKFMTFAGLIAYYVSVVWTLAYVTVMLVNSFRLPQVKMFHALQSIDAYQYWPGLYILGAYQKYEKNNLFTALLLLTILSIMGRINTYIGLASHLMWFVFAGIGIASVCRSTRYKVEHAAPKLFHLIVEMKSGEGIMNVS